jgi:hypothetical protein
MPDAGDMLNRSRSIAGGFGFGRLLGRQGSHGRPRSLSSLTLLDLDLLFLELYTYTPILSVLAGRG